MAEPGFWDNQEQAQSLINDTNRMKEKSENFKQLEAKFDDAQTALELLKAGDNGTSETPDANLWYKKWCHYHKVFMIMNYHYCYQISMINIML